MINSETCGRYIVGSCMIVRLETSLTSLRNGLSSPKILGPPSQDCSWKKLDAIYGCHLGREAVDAGYQSVDVTQLKTESLTYPPQIVAEEGVAADGQILAPGVIMDPENLRRNWEMIAYHPGTGTILVRSTPLTRFPGNLPVLYIPYRSSRLTTKSLSRPSPRCSGA